MRSNRLATIAALLATVVLPVVAYMELSDTTLLSKSLATDIQLTDDSIQGATISAELKHGKSKLGPLEPVFLVVLDQLEASRSAVDYVNLTLPEYSRVTLKNIITVEYNEEAKRYEFLIDPYPTKDDGARFIYVDSRTGKVVPKQKD